MNANKLYTIENIFSDPTILKQYIKNFKVFFDKLDKKETKFITVKSFIRKIFKTKKLKINKILTDQVANIAVKYKNKIYFKSTDSQYFVTNSGE